ncbi:MAG: N-acetylmuramoyl-L-alanine amidase [Prochlorotrichaceae cyanobacterium]
MFQPPSLGKGWKSLLLSSLLTSVLSTVLQAVPAWAGQVMSWRFDRTENRLEFTTNEAVQPQAQLLPNPTRIVVDLPNTVLGRPRLEEAIGGAVQSVRIAQFDANTTRFVIEMATGYTVNPQQIQIQAVSPSRWMVQLPAPQRLELPSNVTGNLGAPTPQTSGVQAPTQIESWRQTPDGLFLRTRGATPRINFRRSRDGRSLELDVFDTVLAANLQDAKFALPELGIERIEFEQRSTEVRIKARLTKNPPNWQASVSNLGGIILLPQGGNQRPATSTGSPVSSPVPSTPSLSQVQAIDLNSSTNQLLIQTSDATRYQGEWVSGEYRITLSPAQLSPNVRGPQLGTDSPLLRVRLRQSDPQTVTIVVQPAASVQIESLQAANDRLLVLALTGSRPITVPTVPRPTNPTVPQPFPTQPTQPTIPSGPSSGRPLVIIDPGHGGPDPGAIGIGNIQEKQIVMDISQQVAGLLQQQGIQVVLTRTGDYDLGLEPRVDMAERANATIFVSIHANAISLSRPEVNGVETYYASAEGRVLASTILQRILNNIPMTNRGVKQANFYVIRRTSMPATLIETGFVTGIEDAPRLADPAFRRQMATAIAQGILEYLR